jgi:hypothetical protein
MRWMIGLITVLNQSKKFLIPSFFIMAYSKCFGGTNANTILSSWGFIFSLQPGDG